MARRPPTDVFAWGGDMGALMRAHDWRGTPLGPVESWPSSLQTAVRIVLSSRFPMWMAWGPELPILYNDPYSAILGSKHPSALGRPTRLVWGEIWPEIGPRIEAVLNRGVTTWDEALPLFMDRRGFMEETYFTFSYSPLADDDGRIAGLICTCVEETERVLGDRRLTALRELATELTTTLSEDEVLAAVCRSLEANPRDLPFALVYQFDEDGRVAHLRCRAGIPEGHPGAPAVVELDGEDLWGLGTVRAERATLDVDDLAERFGELPTGAWSRPPDRAIAVPIPGQGQDPPIGVLVAALNPFRPLDGAYAGVLDLIAGQVASGVASARVYQAELRRAEALAELDRAKTAFFSNVSHEFRTPLTLLLGPIEDLLSGAHGPLSAAQRAELEVTHRNALRLLRQVNALLDFSRIEAGRAHSVYEPTDLGSLTAELASTFRSTIERAGMELRLDTPMLPEPVFVDREMWEKIVLNLISNAFKYTLSGRIEVSLHEVEGMAELVVRDTGVGIPSEHLPHLFERFHRVEAARARTHEGTGIGLALVRELARLHGGDVYVESEPGVGSSFRVRVPFGFTHLPEDHIGATRSMASTATGAAPYTEEALRWLAKGSEPTTAVEQSRAGAELEVHGSQWAIAGARVVVADDNADMRDYVSRLLTRQMLVVEAVPDGAAALAAIRRQRPDLVLSDVMMPNMDGFELLAALRADPSTREIPIVLLSARAGEESEVEGLERGADDYLVKPFSARELVARVAAHLTLARVRQDATAALRESEQRFHNMAEATPVMIWVTDASGACTYLNPSWYRFTGQSESDGVGVGYMAAIHPDDRTIANDALTAAIGRRAPYQCEYRVRTAQGDYRWVLDSAGPRFGPRGDFLGYIGSLLDNHDRRQIEDERARLLAAAEAARTEAEAANRVKSDFLATMSHELRTPLNAIMGYADLLGSGIRGAVDAGQRKYIDRIMESSRHLLQIISEILTFSRIQAGEVEVRLEEVDLAALVRETTGMMEPMAASKDIELRVDVPDELPAVTDPGKVRQIVLNLISNALKFTDHGHVRVSLAGADGQAIVRVEDTGLGVAPEMLEVIFEPFKQVGAPGQPKRGGTGLGLSVTKQLAELLGGSVSVESELGAGSTFEVRLPLGEVGSSATRERHGRQGAENRRARLGFRPG